MIIPIKQKIHIIFNLYFIECIFINFRQIFIKNLNFLIIVKKTLLPRKRTLLTSFGKFFSF